MDKELKQDAKKVELNEDELTNVTGGKEMTSFRNVDGLAEKNQHYPNNVGLSCRKLSD